MVLDQIGVSAEGDRSAPSYQLIVALITAIIGTLSLCDNYRSKID